MTTLPPAEALAVLASHVEERKLFRKRPDSHRLYEGKIINNCFVITPIYVPQDSEETNSSVPVIVGNVSAAYSGSVIHIKMRMHNLITVFLLIWLGGLATYSVRLALREHVDFEFGQLVSIGFAIVLGVGFLCFFIHSFWAQVKEQHNQLLSLFCRSNEQSDSTKLL